MLDPVLMFIAYMGHCREGGSNSARGLGLLALEMMQNGSVQREIGDSGKLVPLSPESWSVEGKRFLETTSTCSINDIKKVR